MTKAGWPMNRTVITKIEAGGKRAANVTIDEMLAFAAVLGAAPVHLIVPWDGDASVAVTPARAVPAKQVRSFIDGTSPLYGRTAADVDYWKFFYYFRPADDILVWRGNVTGLEPRESFAPAKRPTRRKG